MRLSVDRAGAVARRAGLDRGRGGRLRAARGGYRAVMERIGLAPGTEIGGYLVIGPVGEGGWERSTAFATRTAAWWP